MLYCGEERVILAEVFVGPRLCCRNSNTVFFRMDQMFSLCIFLSFSPFVPHVWPSSATRVPSVAMSSNPSWAWPPVGVFVTGEEREILAEVSAGPRSCCRNSNTIFFGTDQMFSL